MDICKKIRTKIINFKTNRYVNRHKKSLLMKLSERSVSNRIYYFCTPTHSNLGDQAQLMCWLRLFKEWYPDYEVVMIPSCYRQFQTIRLIRERITSSDKIFIHSGYLIFDPHPELPLILDIVRAFYDYPITILPQTVNLRGDWYQQIVSRQFNAHSDLTLICRDEVSYYNAQKLFSNVKLRLMPDVVTSLIGNDDFQYHNIKRNGVMFCIRNDGEKLYTDEEMAELRNKFQGVHITISDTTIKANIWEWDKKREDLIRKILKKFSNYQVIITDRYHGTIFSQIVNTPVIVISSTDHKLSSGVNWFPAEHFGRNITFAKNLCDAYNKAMEILSGNVEIVKNPTWFKDTFYSSKI